MNSSILTLETCNNIRNNTISEISPKKGLNKLNEIKDVKIIKYKKRTPKHKKLLNLFNDLLDVILTDKTIKSKSQIDNTLMSSKDEDENENENENKKTLKIIKGLNNYLDEIIDKSKSFEEQTKLIRKVKNLDDYYSINNYGDKELKFKIFKLNLAHLSNEIDEKLFEQIFGHTIETLANKLINKTNKEENQTIVNNTNKKKKKFMKKINLIIL